MMAIHEMVEMVGGPHCGVQWSISSDHDRVWIGPNGVTTKAPRNWEVGVVGPYIRGKGKGANSAITFFYQGLGEMV